MKGWVSGVVDKLQEALGDSVEVVPGERDGVWRGDKDLVAVWWPGWDTLQRDIALASPTLTIRYFPRRGAEQNESAPANADPILDAADALIGTLDRATQAVGYFTEGLSCRLSSLRPDYDPDVWRVEGTLVAYTVSEAG